MDHEKFKDEDDKFEGNHSAAKKVANKDWKDLWMYSVFWTYKLEKGNKGAKYYSLESAFKTSIEPA